MRRIAIDVQRLFSLWNTNLRNDQLAEALGVTRDSLSSLRMRYGLPIRKHASLRGNYSHQPDPTEDEIRERAAAVRARWTPEEEESRRLAAKPYTIPCFAYDGRTVEFSGVDC